MHWETARRASPERTSGLQDEKLAPCKNESPVGEEDLEGFQLNRENANVVAQMGMERLYKTA